MCICGFTLTLGYGNIKENQLEIPKIWSCIFLKPPFYFILKKNLLGWIFYCVFFHLFIFSICIKGDVKKKLLCHSVASLEWGWGEETLSCWYETPNYVQLREWSYRNTRGGSECVCVCVGGGSRGAGPDICYMSAMINGLIRDELVKILLFAHQWEWGQQGAIVPVNMHIFLPISRGRGGLSQLN